MELEKIKNKIKESGLKQKYIAECLGITQNAFSRKMLGKNAFTITEMGKIGEILQLTQDELIDFFLK